MSGEGYDHGLLGRGRDIVPDPVMGLLGPKWGYPLTSVLEIASADSMELYSCGEHGVDPPQRQVPPLWTNLGQW